MADVQLEHGYTRLANALLEALAAASLPGPRHFQVMLAMIRLLYGYNRTEDRISLAQVSHATSLDASNVRIVLGDLVAFRMLESIDVRQGRAGIWRIQKDPDLWNFSRRQPRSSTTEVGKQLQSSATEALQSPTTEELQSSATYTKDRKTKRKTKSVSEEPSNGSAVETPEQAEAVAKAKLERDVARAGSILAGLEGSAEEKRRWLRANLRAAESWAKDRSDEGKRTSIQTALRTWWNRYLSGARTYKAEIEREERLAKDRRWNDEFDLKKYGRLLSAEEIPDFARDA